MIVREARRPRYFHERAQHLRQFLLVNHPVAVVVAHVEDDPQLVLGLAAREQQHGVEELLEGYATVAVLVNDVEHLGDEDRVVLHAQSAGELAFRQGRAHHCHHLAALAVLGAPATLART